MKLLKIELCVWVTKQLYISPLFAYQVIPWSSVCDHVNSPLEPTVLQQLTSDWGQNKL